jgi:putative peptide zinc metalloprotease protein
LDLADTRAKLRSDLEIRPETSDPQSPVIVKDPVTQRFFRFTFVQSRVLAALDGRRDHAVIAESVSAECGVTVARNQVDDFSGKLQGLLLLDSPLSWARLQELKPPRHRILDSLLSIKIRAFHPDRMLAWLDRRWGGFFFGAAFHYFAWVSILGGVILSLVNWEQLYLSLPQIFSLYSVPLILLVAFAVMTIHEMGHALALRHFGGRVQEMGFLILYLIPGFYCNVSDAWLLRRRERMLVSIAGGYIQAVVCAWAVIMWRFFSPETWASHTCLIVVAFSGIQALFNFNPLLRMDGYYLLSDFLEMPNLRQKSFGYLQRKLEYWVTGVSLRGPQLLVRERRIFALYGFTSFLFSATLLVIILGRLGTWMIGEYRTWGILVFSALCLMVVQGPGGENLAKTARIAAGVTRRLRKAPYLLLGVVLILAAGLLPWELKVTGEFMIQPSSAVDIHPQVEGTLKSINVEEGDLVKRGDVLAEIQNLELSNTYEETRGELASSEASLRLLKAGNRPEEIEKAQNAVATRQTDLDNASRIEQERRVLQDTVSKREAALRNAQSIFERSQTLFSQGLIARNELERDQTAFAVGQKELAEALGQQKVLEERVEREKQLKGSALLEAKSDLKILMAGSRKESIQAVEANVSRLQEKLGILEQQLAQLSIRSPIDGVISTPYLKNRIGEYLEKGRLLCQIVDVRWVKVDIPVPEKEIADVSPGQLTILKMNAYPKASWVARVKSISPIAIEGSSERKVIIRAELSNADGQLKGGMTGVAKILCGRRMIGELVTRRLIRWLRTEFWEYLP